jgi:[ribosomal protein S5]-alanine N-acetyltransferase
MIETDRLKVRAFLPDDAVDLHEYLSDPAVYVFEPGAPVSLAEANEMAQQRALGSDFWAVELKENRKQIGHLYFNRVDPDERKMWELGYIFNPEYQKQGFASEAARALVEYAFRNLEVHRIMARCDPRNTPSWKLLEGIGFRREAHFRMYGFFRRDAQGHPLWHDAYEYAMLETDISTSKNHRIDGSRGI